MLKLKQYINESFSELVNKVTWPTWSELTGSAIVVLVASIIIALVVFVMDSVFTWGIGNLYKSLF
jgi:preprotein translocase subunit SecE